MGRLREHDGLSPLVEVERAVQERAKATSLDMAAASGGERLRTIIEDEVRKWSDDHKRGLRPFDLPDPELVIERAYRNLAGYGPLQPLLDDDNVWEIMVNAPDVVVVGDWDCDGTSTPSVLRPSEHRLFVFDDWATADAPLTARPGPDVPADAIDVEAKGCGQAAVATKSGGVVVVSTRGGDR